MAGEVGYLPIGEPSDDADAERRGRFEAVAAGDAVVRRAGDAGLEVDSPQRIFELARDGDVRAQRVVDEQARVLALGLATIVPIVDPELVIVGGGVGHNGEVLLDPLRDQLRRLSPFVPEVITSALGTDAVLRGAVGSALDAGWEHVLTAGVS